MNGSGRGHLCLRGLWIFVAVGLLGLGLPAGRALAHGPCRTVPLPVACSGAIGNLAYVTAQGSGFVQGVSPFRFVGTNAYFIFDAASYGSDAHVWEMMHLANDLGFTVLRTWGFMNAGVSGNDGTLNQRLLQPLPWVYNDGGAHTNPWTGQEYQTVRDEFRHLDYVLATANTHQVKLILTLGNNWKEYGGIDQYLKWCPCGVSSPQPVHFYTHPDCIALYKGYITQVVTRTNSLNGRRYADDPTIFAWELMNEPRCQGCDPAVVTAWMADMAAHIKGLGAHQMIATGEEGFDCTKTGVYTADGYNDPKNIRWHPWMYDGSQGLCYTKNTKLPGIDFGSYHMYPESWRLASESEGPWITDHINIATAAGKPTVLGEFGSTRKDRYTRFESWLNAVESSQGAGALGWEIMCPICQNHATRLDVIFPPVTKESGTYCTHANRVNGWIPSAPCSPTQLYPAQ
ncbi:MAG TPA: cellulase family glycosylhydrolase [Methylomirabilota bacterium]|jgi:mannan endo-1,4-beta-mannosidase|nr:cellulase family glycosylhydrolase [Methylomirabilota bacterium]